MKNKEEQPYIEKEGSIKSIISDRIKQLESEKVNEVSTFEEFAITCRINELSNLLATLENSGTNISEEKYNPNYGDNRECECGHVYYRHFDSYENMYPIGCKYCQCSFFKEKK